MSTQALTVEGPTLVDNGDTYISSSVALVTRASLPAIDEGSGDTVAVGAEIRFEATGGAPIVVLTADGRFVGLVPGRGQAVVVAEAGAAQSEVDFWRFQILANTPAAFQSVAGTYAQAEVTAIRDCLVNAGLMKAE